MNRISSITGTRRSSGRVVLAAFLGGTVGLTAPAWGQVINEDYKLLASDGAANDQFGISIAIDNGKVAVGSRWNDVNGVNSGAVYVYGTFTGNEIAALRSTDGRPNDTLGSSVAIENNIVAAGAMNSDSSGVDKSGAAYLFDAVTGAQLFRIQSNRPYSQAQFGNSIAIDGGVVAVGSHFDGVSPSSQPGSVYLFDVSTGALTARLLAVDGVTEDKFGQSVAIDSGIVAIGAPGDDDHGAGSGSAYLFDATTGGQITKLIPTDGAAHDRFGWSVAIRDGVVAVGAYLDDDNGNNSGSVYLFDAATGAQIAKILPNVGSADAWFGWSVALDSGILAVTSTAGDDYLFDVATGTQIDQLLSSDNEAGDSFGWAVAMDNGIVAISALRDDDNGIDAGAAYVFDVSCRADLNDDGSLDAADVSIFLDLYNNNDPIADWNYDGTINFFDISGYMNDHNAGCPNS